MGGWDHHRTLKDSLTNSCTAIDKPIAGLLQDLKNRGMLKDTLVLWGGEFGRTPTSQGDGRDHNSRGYSTWMAGGGAKGGLRYGATDDHGFAAVDGRMHVHDWHATILHLLGLEHTKLTYRHAGRDMRLTDVKGNVVKEVVA
jgi:arylsulfatase A-like enzyme